MRTVLRGQLGLKLNKTAHLPNILKIGLAGWDVIRFDPSQYNSVFPIKSLLDWFRNRLRSLPALSAVSFSLALITFK